MTDTRNLQRALVRGCGAIVITALAFLGSTAVAGAYELAFCAPSAAWPASDRERPGFDNAVAEILADELGATATFTWTRFDDVGIRDSLHSGLCDVAVGVGEGVAQVLSTVPYLKTPYVFVTRSDRGLSIASLDDPLLETLTIGTYQSGIPSVALRNRGIVTNVREIAAAVTSRGVDGHTPILDAVVAGDVDVGIVYGPMAGHRALQEQGALQIEAVTPEIDFGATLLQLSRIWTIGVRPHDEALRDRLNRALAARWDDVIAAMDAYGVPQLPISQPRVTEIPPDAMRVGVIYPARTPASLPNAEVGENARLATAVAENAVATAAQRGTPFVVLRSSAPTIEAVERAALGLVHSGDVDALVGGWTAAEAHLLARIAAEHDVAYFNVGAEDDALRDRRCYPTTVHVAPSGSMLVAAIPQVLPDAAAQRTFAIAERGTHTEGLVEPLAERLAAAGGELVGSALVDPDQFIFFGEFEAIRAAGADALVLLMGAEAQERFMGQAGAARLDVVITGLGTIRGHSRPFLQRYLQVAREAGAGPRVVAWDPAVANDTNERFAARTGEPMEAAAWSTYAAILSAFAAAQADVLHDTAALLAFLTDASTRLEVGKGQLVRYRTEDGQMLQELYVVEADPEAPWGRTAAARTATARVVAVIPADATDAAGVAAGDASEVCPGR
jgi:mxaJ protein